MGDHKHHHNHHHHDQSRGVTPVPDTPSVRAWSISGRRKSNASSFKHPSIANMFNRQDNDSSSVSSSLMSGSKSARRAKSQIGFRERTMSPTPMR